MPAPTLDGRLLCASACAYAVASDGVLALGPASPLYTGAGFVRPPTTFVGGNSLTDACLVGTTSDGVVLAFRGTLPPDLHAPRTLLDWLNDFNARPLSATGYPGLVHAGFLGALLSLWDHALGEVRRQGAGGGVPLLVTGHSKGGAMAVLAAWRLQPELCVWARVVTFAAPKPGDGTFRDAYDTWVEHTRYEYADDIVPHLPPSPAGFLGVLKSLPVVGADFAGLECFDYEPVGTLRFIDWSGRVVENAPALGVDRTLSLVRLVARLRFLQIAADHAVGCGTGYMTALCPTGVCPELLP